VEVRDPLPGRPDADKRPHIPVLLTPLLKEVAPVSGTWADGTFGAGGYARGLLAAGAAKVLGIDRDPLALQLAASWAPDYGPRLALRAGTFSDLDTLAGEPLDGRSTSPSAAFPFRRTAPWTCG
jgi:16S rRNA (cytosine1402-N4)-methyltransferase